MSFISHTSVARFVRSSFPGCPAPDRVEVVKLARTFQGLGVVAVRPSERSFSGWVAVCSFRSHTAAIAFSQAAAELSGDGCFYAVRSARSRFRVSVPCLNPPLFAIRPRRGVRLGKLSGS